MSPPPLLRPALPGDVDDIVALVESAFRGESSRAGWTTEADLLDGRRTGADEIAAILASPDQRVMLHHDPAGRLLASVVLARDADTSWLGMLSIRPTLQGRGTGRAVLEAAEEWVRRHWGATRMRMKVIGQRAELIAWYERRGYRRTGETAPFYYGDPRFGLPKRQDLYFEVLEKQLSERSAS